MQDDVRKAFMPTPVNQTSPVLMELLGFLVDAGHALVKTTMDEAENNANVPVGTTMARIEQGMVVFNAIHSRLHDAMGKFLRVLHRLLGTYLDDKQVLEETGEQMVFKADFDAPDDVIPVSDPEIFSELQRMAQIQTIAQRAQLFPALYDPHEVETEILRRMKIKDPERFLIPKPKPKPEHAINENIMASLGQPVVAFPDQDHLAHIQCHAMFLEDPMLGANPLFAPQAIPALLDNLKQHMLFYYGMTVFETAQKALSDTGEKRDLNEFKEINDPAVSSEFDRLLAAAVQHVHPQLQQTFQKLGPLIQKCEQQLKQSQPPQPMDPSQASLQIAKGDQAIKQQQVQQQGQKNQTDAQLKSQQLAQDKAQTDAENALQQATMAGQAQIDAANNQTKLAVSGQTNQTKLQTTQADNDTAMEIAAAEIEAGKHTNIKDGAAIGGKPRSQ